MSDRFDVSKKESIENPSDFDELEDVKRFFIYGESTFRDIFQPMISARFPARCYGFLSSTRATDRDAVSAYVPRFWEEALAHLGPGDYVFLVRRNEDVEIRLLEKGVRIGLPFNIRLIYGSYETPTFLHFCKKYLTEGGIALDIGGNIGLTGAMLASFCDHVHIFEANPAMEKLIHETNIGHPNISIHMKAVFQQAGMVTIYPSGVNNTSMVAENKIDPLQVPCLSVDEFCSEMKLAPTVLKIDVEGVGGEVLLGAAHTIEAHHPFIFLEHPLAMEGTNRDIGRQALAFLRESYDLLAYPTLNRLLPADALGMPLDRFEERHGLGGNIAAIPR